MPPCGLTALHACQLADTCQVMPPCGLKLACHLVVLQPCTPVNLQTRAKLCHHVKGTPAPVRKATSVAHAYPASPHNPPQPCGKGAGSVVTCPGHTQEPKANPAVIPLCWHTNFGGGCVPTTKPSSLIGTTYQPVGRCTAQPAGRQQAAAAASQPGSCTWQMTPCNTYAMCSNWQLGQKPNARGTTASCWTCAMHATLWTYWLYVCRQCSTP